MFKIETILIVLVDGTVNPRLAIVREAATLCYWSLEAGIAMLESLVGLL